MLRTVAPKLRAVCSSSSSSSSKFTCSGFSIRGFSNTNGDLISNQNHNANNSYASGHRLCQVSRYSTQSSSSSSSGIQQRISQLVKENKIVVFMKGVPAEPRCGFSNAVVKILEFHGIGHDQYSAHNVLEDEELRQGIKEFSDWPTIPQVYFNSEFIGGCDVLLEMHKNGDLVQELSKLGIKSALVE